MELSVVLRCIKQLLSPPKQGSSVLLSLRETLEAFQSFVRERERTNELETAISSLNIPQNATFTDKVVVYCKFTEQGLALLTLLDEALKQAHREDLSHAQGPTENHSEHNQKPPPKAILSSADEKCVSTLLQSVVALGIFPFLLPGVDHLLCAKLGEMAPQITKSSTDLPTKSLLLLHHCRPIVRLFESPVIGPSVVSRHLSTVLVALLQASHCATLQQQHWRERSSEGDTEVANCSSEGGSNAPMLSAVNVQEELTCLLDKLHQPVVVRELLRIQGAQRGAGGTPKWLQKACGSLLSGRLMKEDGVHAVLRGIFDTIAGGEGVGSGCHGDWKRVQAVARIISRCPSQASSFSHYYSIIGPQLLKLLTLSDRAPVQVSAATLSLMVKTQPGLTRTHVILPLTAPLTTIATGVFAEVESLADLGRAAESTVGSLHRLCGCVEPSSPLMPELQPFLPVLFKIWQATSGADKITKNIKSDVESVFLAIFNSLGSVDKIQFLRHLAAMPLSSAGGVKWIAVSPEVSLSYPAEERGLSVGRVGVGSVERMEKDGGAIVELLGTTLAPSQLIGGFFTECLTCVVAILCMDIGYQAQSSRIKTEIKSHLSVQVDPKLSNSSASSVLLDIEKETGERKQAELYRRSLALYLTAALSEERTSTVLQQTDTTELLEILAVAVECHSHTVTRKNKTLSSSVNLLVVQPDLDSMLGGSISLSIALGYLSAILAGADQLDKEQRGVLSGLLGYLEVVSNGYPDTELARLAGDLRVCIATLGAVWSREMREWAEGMKGGRGNRAVQRESENQSKSKKSEKEKTRPLVTGERSDLKQTENEKPVRKLIEEIPETNTQHSANNRDGKEGREGNSSRFQQALMEAQDLEIPVRGHGLSSLARLVTSGDRETLTHSDRLLELFRAALHNSDSYVYLPAIGGLVGLASREPRKVIEILCEGYALFSGPPRNRQRIDKETGILNVEKHSESGRTDEETDSTEVLVDVRLKLGEALVRVSRECGELLPYYSDPLLAAVLSNARDPHPLVRASALSNLADICHLLGHSFHRYHHEVLSCVTHLLQSDPTPQVQQSALLVMTLLLKGLSHDSVEVLGDSLRDVYRLLKTVEREGGREDLTREHARAALSHLDLIMRTWAFPQPSLSKNITL